MQNLRTFDEDMYSQFTDLRGGGGKTLQVTNPNLNVNIETTTFFHPRLTGSQRNSHETVWITVLQDSRDQLSII